MGPLGRGVRRVNTRCDNFIYIRHPVGLSGYAVLVRSTGAYLGVVYETEGAGWCASYPQDIPGSGGAIPGFRSRQFAVDFLAAYQKPTVRTD